jgi:hypothetical protein
MCIGSATTPQPISCVEFTGMMEVHVCKRDGEVLRAFALGDTGELLVGRDDSCDIQIRATSVSREHCAIERDGEDLFVRDLGSSGGTYINGAKIQKAKVADGVEVAVGPALLKFVESEF